MLIRKLYLFIGLSLFFQYACFAEIPPASQITRSQELIQQEENLTSAFEDTKVFVKKIVISGADSLTQDKIKELTLPFENHWLGKEDIQQIINFIIQAYKDQKYLDLGLIKFSQQVKNGTLEIEVKELKKAKKP